MSLAENDDYRTMWLSTLQSCSYSTSNVSADDESIKEGSLQVDQGPFLLTDLPPELLQLILRNLSFENIAKVRRVCQHFNNLCSSLLNSEFNRLRTVMQQRFQSIKAQMPRRESARRKHPLARESDIIETLHMRLSLLHMTFGKHIERKHCCFFAGEILDEVYRILKYVESTPSLSRAYKVTDELFDLSTMAMEYFKEHIEPTLPEITYFAADFLEYTPSLTSSPKTQVSLLEESIACNSSSHTKSSNETLPSLSAVSPAVNKRIRKIRENLKRNNSQVVAMKQSLKMTRKKLVSHQKEIQQLKLQYKDYDKKFLNASRKLNAVLQELNQCKTELQYWRSKSPATQCSCGKSTPVFELKDLDLDPVDSNHSLSSQNQELDDFKPIDSEPTTDPDYYVIVSKTHSTPATNSIPMSLLTPVTKWKALKNKASATDRIYPMLSQTKYSNAKGCKRKLNMDDDVDDCEDYNDDDEDYDYCGGGGYDHPENDQEKSKQFHSSSGSKASSVSKYVPNMSCSCKKSLSNSSPPTYLHSSSMSVTDHCGFGSINHEQSYDDDVNYVIHPKRENRYKQLSKNNILVVDKKTHINKLHKFNINVKPKNETIAATSSHNSLLLNNTFGICSSSHKVTPLLSKCKVLNKKSLPSLVAKKNWQNQSEDRSLQLQNHQPKKLKRLQTYILKSNGSICG